MFLVGWSIGSVVVGCGSLVAFGWSHGDDVNWVVGSVVCSHGDVVVFGLVVCFGCCSSWVVEFSSSGGCCGWGVVS